jgi:predicted acetyltransferase
MNLRFELPEIRHYELAKEYIEEFKTFKSKIHGSGGLDIEHYEEWGKLTQSSHEGNELRSKCAPASTYFVFDEDRDVLVGMINIRHELTQYLIDTGSGHIGYSIRPTERRKGYATKMLHMGLHIAKEFGVKEALLGCYNDNVGSRKTILNNGGVFQKEIRDEDGKITQLILLELIQ